MKLNNTFILINRDSVAESRDWATAHAAIKSAILSTSWPSASNTGLVIPRIVSIKPGETYTNERGKSVVWRGDKPKTLRNGVVPLRQMFRHNLETSGWRAEEPLNLKEFFQTIRTGKEFRRISLYPKPEPASGPITPLHEGVGDFDFWLRTSTGFRTVVEWETGNISSSHRSLNKMCLALMGGLVDAAVLVVPSIYLYPHLTDRIGNVKELQPYFYFWNKVGELVRHGVLAVIEVEQDKLYKSTDMRDFIPSSEAGNAFRAAAPPQKPPSKRSRLSKLK